MDAPTRKKAQTRLFVGMAALAGSAVALRFHNDFLAGLGVGIGLPMFYLGFRLWNGRHE